MLLKQKKGIVYRIVCLSHPDIQYVGSTFNTLRQRWQCHKKSYTKWMKEDKKRGKCSIYPYFEQYGIEDFKILLIKEYQCVSETNKDHLHLSTYEQLWINKITCVNIYNPLKKPKWLVKKITKLYRDEHKVERNDKQKLYAKSHKEEKKIYDKKYREENVEMLYQKGVKYRKENIEIIARKKKEWGSKIIECECGSKIRTDSKSRHSNSKKHIKFLKEKLDSK